MTDWDNLLQDDQEEYRMWITPQFTVADACGVTGATPKAIEHFVNPSRHLVQLSDSRATPGKGKRRMFNGWDMLQLKTAYEASNIGLPQRHTATLAKMVVRHAEARMRGLVPQNGKLLAQYPQPNGEWVIAHIRQGSAEPNLPAVLQVVDVDRLIDETKAQLEAIVEGRPLPDFSLSEPTPEPDPFSPRGNFFRAWEMDDQGRWKHVGLTCDESEELLRLKGQKLVGDELETDPSFELPREDHDRYLDLHSRHETARLKALFPNSDQEAP